MRGGKISLVSLGQVVMGKKKVTPRQVRTPTAFWCPSCCCHTESEKRAVEYFNRVYSAWDTVYVDSCVSCDAMGYIPAKEYESLIRGSRIIALCVITLITSPGIAATYFSATESASAWDAITTFCLKGIWVLCVSSAMFLIIGGTFYGSTFLRYRKWRNWAREQH